MKYQRFIAQLPSFYDNWGKDSVTLKSHRFEPIIQQIKGMTSVNVMQLLNCAIECLEDNEIYCEVGCFQGASLIGALLGHPEQIAYAVDNFSAFDLEGDSFDKLLENLSKFELEEQVIFCNQDVEEFFFELRESQLEEKIGLYFYDGSQDYRSRLMGLLLVKPFLADKALIVLSNCNWESTNQASWDFLKAHPQSSLLLDFSTRQDDIYSVWNGLQVIGWDMNNNHQYDWSSLQQFRKTTLIRAIAELHVPCRQKTLNKWLNQAQELYLSAKYEEAKKKYKQVLSCEINHAEAWYNLGRLYYETERYKDALDSLLSALELDSSKAIWHYYLGRVLEKVGDIPQAIQVYQEAIAIDSQLISAYNSLGNIWFEAGELEKAESMYRQVIVGCPDHFAGYINLGNILLSKHQVDQAITAYQTALSFKPDDADILNNLGVACEAQNQPDQAYLYFGYSFYYQGKYQEAIEQYQKFKETHTGDIAFYLALADCYQCLNQYEETLKFYREGISIYPQAEILYSRCSSTLQEFGRMKEASAVFIEALLVLPEALNLRLQKQLMLPIIYETTEEIEDYRKQFTQGLEELIQQTSLDTPEAINNALKAVGSQTNYYLQCQGKNDLELQVRYGQFVHQVMARQYPKWAKSIPISPIKKRVKIRVGYVSAYLRNHTVGQLMLGWIKNHNQNNFEIYCYHTGRSSDQITRQFQLYSDTFHHLPEDLEAVCKQIISDQLDILVFTDIGMHPQSTQMAGLRLAPVQCVTWGHPITSGLPTIDYFLSSELMEPENAEEHYSEKLICLPNIGIVYEKPVIPEPTKTRSDFQLREDAIVYLSCQSLFKYLPQYDYIFPAIAQQVPQAQFAFLSHQSSLQITEKFRHRLQRAFAIFNLNCDDYCVILQRQDWLGYSNLNLISDIYLDTFSWSGGHSTLEAIACNLPVVTCPGEFMRSRHSYGILQMLGVTETIATNENEYLQVAVRLGQEPRWRASIVQQMIQRHFHLYDDIICLSFLEGFYQSIAS
ncbi:MAG: tetratricopeptide repeat protein [Potamolinea sp.]